VAAVQAEVVVVVVVVIVVVAVTVSLSFALRVEGYRLPRFLSAVWEVLTAVNLTLASGIVKVECEGGSVKVECTSLPL